MSEASVLIAEHNVPIAGLAPALDGVRIAHISDLHLRRWDRVTQAAQEALATLDYDVLAATGDFGCFRRHWRQAALLARRFFEPLAARGPVYAVLGNHDDPRLATAPDMPLTFLRNESRRMQFNGAALFLAGVDQFRRRTERLDLALSETSPDAPVVLLAHYPSTVFRLRSTQAALVLSGHTHGGQIRFPWIGCAWANDRIPRAMSRGLHGVNGTHLHVSPGIGVSLPLRVRINCPAEVAVLSLRSKVVVAEPPKKRPPKTVETAEVIV